MDAQLEAFLLSPKYAADLVSDGGAPLWRDFRPADALIFSHRTVDYTQTGFDDLAHTHDFCELVIYLGGSVEYLAERSLYSPCFGDIFLASPREIHGARLLRPSVYERYVLWFPSDLFGCFEDGRRAMLPFSAQLRTPGTRNLLRPHERELPALLALLREAELALSATPVRELEGCAALLRFFGRLGELWANSAHTDIDPVSLPPTLHAALGCIETDYAALRGVSEIAEKIHVSSEHLSRLFTGQFGIPISEYLRRHRLNESKRLLLAGASVTEACYAVGFANISHFIRCFHNYVGMTPARYRALSAENNKPT